MRIYTNLFNYTQEELKAFYEAKKTIIGAYSKFYEIQYSQAQNQFYCVQLNYFFNTKKHGYGFAKKGYHHVLTPAEANYILKEKVFNEEE